jgi:hypothetical protein
MRWEAALPGPGREGDVVTGVEWASLGVAGTAVIGAVAVLLFIGTKFDAVNARIDALGARLDARIHALSDRIDALSARMDARLDELSGRMDALTARFDAHLRDHGKAS